MPDYQLVKNKIHIKMNRDLKLVHDPTKRGQTHSLRNTGPGLFLGLERATSATSWLGRGS